MYETQKQHIDERELDKHRIDRVFKVNSVAELARELLGNDAEIILEKDDKLREGLNTLFDRLEVARQKCDAEVSLFVVSVTNDTRITGKWLVVARSAQGVAEHQQIIMRMNAFFQKEKQRYKKMERPMGVGCHELHPNAYSCVIDEERVVDIGLASYQGVEGAKSIYFESQKSWWPDNHEIALKKSPKTGKDVIVDFVVSDDRFRPEIYRTAAGRVFSDDDFKESPPTPDEITDLKTAVQLDPLFDGFVIIDDSEKTYNDAGQYSKNYKPRYIDYPDDPSLTLIFYGGSWSLKGRRYGGDYQDFGLDRYSDDF